MNTLRALWRHHKLLLLGFSLAVLATVLLCVRLVVLTVYFANHRDMALEGWMPLGYVARSYDVDVQALQNAIGDTPDISRHSSLAEIAEIQHRPLEGLEADILEAVQTTRSGR